MAEANKKQNFFVRTGKRIGRWFREMRSELKKVVWPSKRQLINNTLVVLACVAVVSIFLFVFDTIASNLIKGIIDLAHL